MPYLTRELISDAYYLSRIVARNLQSVSGQQLTDGLQWLNDILLEKTIDERHIPYYEEYQFDAVPGQEKYFIANLITAETLTFNIGTVRFSMRPINSNQYHGCTRTEEIESLPYSWAINKVRGGADIYLYFSPDKDYPLKLWGKFSLSEVISPDQDLLLSYDRFYIHYLEYELAREICDHYTITTPPNVLRKLEILEQKTLDVSPQDLSMQKLSSLQRETGINYADINIGRGWRPGD